ncbi:4-hydroxy-tetrahydrodipicolinate synthase [Antrihabitans sp. YC3-6]|uniref:4-hydroxy-tetrahydrodipicolinate synthase n=1 Tax=Antrihabitans stalagmiti TaxID=2799499 RepID=A0A934U2I1_9NOCA|nr:4-hydroxy-tetrahydrodipicolinate synthase [Antrihabitans stalagmiti]MBJ8339030.1 4-hydroxy-tetrahydrodipicolinate synthase [Antrihabitans stalagmiti]
MTLSGLFVPLVTPFEDDGDIAFTALERLAHSVLDGGATGLVALATTAETSTLTADERSRVLAVCVRVCEERDVPLIAGAGSNSTAESVAAVAQLGLRVTAALSVVPYYTRPSQAGIVAHFTRLAGTSPVPLIVYNIPYRTGVGLDADTLFQLARIPNIIGFKHAVGGIDDATMAMMSCVPDGFAVLAGDDLYASPLLALGATGAITASANVATAAFAALVDAWHAGETARAQKRGHSLVALTSALFAEPNPVVIKSVLAAQGIIPSSFVRLPLLPATASARDRALRTL